MSREKPRNLAASVRQRLFNRAQERREDFGLVLTKYGLERFLYRLAQSQYRDQFILKGALLFELWTHRPYRPTRDLDLEGQGTNSIARIKRLFSEIISQAVEDDGLVFDPKSLRVARIKEDQEYEGLRVNFVARLERARIHMQVDVGFGDVIVPPPKDIQYPAMLNFPSPRLRAYPHGKRTLRAGRQAEGQLQHLRKWARCACQPLNGQSYRPPRQRHGLEKLQHADRLPLRYEDVHGTQERTVHRHRLRRA
ncbi:MAG: nucleotidyl transferase AbiEii/AbiGii toxin family protein [Candidatus Acidiferrales bacterium]